MAKGFSKIGIGVFMVLASLCMTAEEEIWLKDPVLLGQRMESEGVYVKMVRGFKLYRGDLFLLDEEAGQILHIDLPSGRLKNRISRRGQGPGDLNMPSQMVIRNDIIYVKDSAHIHRFALDGSFLGRFRRSMFRRGRLATDFAVNGDGEIFLAFPSRKSDRLVRVYDETGNHLRSLVRRKLTADDVLRFRTEAQYDVQLDENGNIYLLFDMLRELWKCDPSGRPIWKKPVSNPLLDQYENQDGARYNQRGGISCRRSIYGFQVLPRGHVLIYHRGGGVLLDPDGNRISLVKSISPFRDYKLVNLGFMVCIGDQWVALNYFMGSEEIAIYKNQYFRRMQ